MSKAITIVGSGLAGMSSAAYLAKQGHRVRILEKNSTYGGRLQSFTEKGFTFDSGPSWYWMPDLFDSFFADFNKQTSDYYSLKRLDPGYRIFFDKEEYFDVFEDYQRLKMELNQIEEGAGEALDSFLYDAKKKYEIAVDKFIYKPSLSPLEFIRYDLVKHLGRLSIFKPISKHIREYFKDERIIKMLEFPSLLLGAKPSATPALYSIMNYADIALGTWYPSGGIRSIATALYDLALEQGVEFEFNQNIEHIRIEKNRAVEVVSSKNKYTSDIVIANADYEHVDSVMLEKKYRNYSKKYWEKRTISPSALLFYLGLNKQIDIPHHCLFFDTSFKKHVEDIYDSPRWPNAPLFYTSCTSKSDPNVAPEGCEALFVLIPVAPGLKEKTISRESYLNQVVERIEAMTGESLKENIVVNKSYAHEEFIADFNSFKT